MAEETREASFRGIPFRVFESAKPIGRRVQTRQQPFGGHRNLDLGETLEAFSVRGYVSGPGYEARRDALVEAFNAEGPGEFVDPWLGTLQVRVLESSRLTHSRSRGGSAHFTLEFVREGEATGPAVRPDSAALVGASADLAIALAQDDFADAFDQVPEVPGQIPLLETILEIQEAVDAARDFVSDALDVFDDLTSDIRAVIDGVEDLTRSIEEFRSDLVDLVSAPAQLAQRALEVGVRLKNSITNPLDLLGAWRRLFNYGDEVFGVSARTTTDAARLQSQRAIASIFQRQAAIEAARAASQATFETSDDALAARAEIIAQIDKLEAHAGDDLVAELQDLRARLARDIADRAASLPQLTTFTPLADVPVFVIAHHLYGNSWLEDGRDEQILSRNQVSHPGFLPAGEPLEVLSA